MIIISVREQPELTESAIGADNPLSQWYLLMRNQSVIGCAGLITNDFISRGELYPWLCALFIEEQYRGQGHAAWLIQHIAAQTRSLGFRQLHLCTDLEGLYEKLHFVFNGVGYHPWGESSRVDTLKL
ncbi:GNAT family N-acetyltransferase [Serratia rubidaea]|uniref:GNAT family N-acetyltransferase n=1 Tax=Serratia rubidaea TaxID=61652 RepID=UPI0022B8A6EC|nr:GNAT family N-acetyltransferase [Serratia rubidaea]WBF47168.1 GNAT family N-acetyltransferase [Serratia rubidaea]